MSNYKNIKLDIPFFKEGVTFNTKSSHYTLEKSLSQELYNIIESGGLTIHLVEVFYRKPGSPSPIHTDGRGQTDIGKLNFVFDTSNSKMVWYAVKEGTNPKMKNTNIGTKYNSYDINDVDVIESIHLTGPVIIQAGIPHNIIDITTPRTCVSVVMMKNGQLATIEQITDVFSKYVVN